MSTAYDKKLRSVGLKLAEDLGMKDFVREGVYSFQCGPFFETVGECRLLNVLGADVTGRTTDFSNSTNEDINYNIMVLLICTGL